MSKHGILFPLSFAIYLAYLRAVPYVTARTWADIVALFAALALLYQISYMIFFRKKQGITFGRAVASFFLYLTVLGDIVVAYIYLNAFINGIAWGFLTFSTKTYYGFEAWSEMAWESLILLPFLAICSIYQLAYFGISHYKKKKALENKA